MNIQKLNSSVGPFAGISYANNRFTKIGISQLIDNVLGRRVEIIGFDYSKILRNLSNVFLSGVCVIEDISTFDYRSILTNDWESTEKKKTCPGALI